MNLKLSNIIYVYMKFSAVIITAVINQNISFHMCWMHTHTQIYTATVYEDTYHRTTSPNSCNIWMTVGQVLFDSVTEKFIHYCFYFLLLCYPLCFILRCFYHDCATHLCLALIILKFFYVLEPEASSISYIQGCFVTEPFNSQIPRYKGNTWIS